MHWEDAPDRTYRATSWKYQESAGQIWQVLASKDKGGQASGKYHKSADGYQGRFKGAPPARKTFFTLKGLHKSIILPRLSTRIIVNLSGIAKGNTRKGTTMRPKKTQWKGQRKYLVEAPKDGLHQRNAKI